MCDRLAGFRGLGVMLGWACCAPPAWFQSMTSDILESIIFILMGRNSMAGFKDPKINERLSEEGVRNRFRYFIGTDSTQSIYLTK